MRAWTSLAQWVGTERGLQAVDRVEESWPGYGQVAASSILNAYYTDTDVVLGVWDWLQRHGVTHGVGFEPGCGRGDWIAAAPDAGPLRRRRHRPDLGAGRHCVDRRERRRVAHRGMAPRP